jgi:hypothetical protein
MDTFIKKGYGRCCGYEFRDWRLELFDKARLMWRKKAKLVVPLPYIVLTGNATTHQFDQLYEHPIIR